MRKLKVYYANISNMGDRLNELILSGCFGYKMERHSVLTGELSAIGSGLDMFTLHGTTLMRMQQRLYGALMPRIAVWGTGFLNYASGAERFFRKMDFFAVRGELSRKRVERITGLSLKIPTGDAGLLCTELIEERKAGRGRLCIVPHVCDLRLDNLEQLLSGCGEYEMIDVRDEPIGVLRQIASCSYVLSSSLHGLVVADAFGIPNRHILLSDKPKGDGFKFDDYYSSYGVEHVVTDLRTEPPPSKAEIEAGYLISSSAVEEKRRSLRECFPFDAERVRT